MSRKVRVWAGAVLVLIGLGVGGFVAVAGLDKGDQLASVIAALTGLIALWLAIRAASPPTDADDLSSSVGSSAPSIGRVLKERWLLLSSLGSVTVIGISVAIILIKSGDPSQPPLPVGTPTPILTSTTPPPTPMPSPPPVGVLASRDFRKDGVPLHLEINSLTHNGLRLALRWSVRNDGTKDWPFANTAFMDPSAGMQPRGYGSTGGVVVLDRAGRPFRVSVQENLCLCSYPDTLEADGDPAPYWAHFYDVPVTTKIVNINVPGVGLLENLPVSAE